MDAIEEFRFKLAKAKDLPPTWFELVLAPKRFQEHVTALHVNRNLEPSALSLIAMFLEKAGCLEGQTPSAEGAAKFSQDRRDTLVNCALFMAAFLEWNLILMERGLPPAVMYSLLKSLVTIFPLPSSSLSLPSLSTVPHETLTAHILYNLWIIRFTTQCDILAAPQGLLWEGTCAPVDTIKQLVLPQTNTAISFLMKACDLRIDFPLPSTKLKLATSLTGTDLLSITLPLSLTSFTWRAIHSQVYFDVGQVLFEQEEYNRSLQCFQSCDQLILTLSAEGKLDHTPPYPCIDKDQLAGYLAACSSFDVGWVEGEEPQDETAAVIAFEQFRKRTSESKSTELSSLLSGVAAVNDSYRAGLSLDLSDWSDSVAMEPSASKRAHLEDQISLSIPAQFNIWYTVWSVAEGRGVQPTALKALTSSLTKEKETLHSLFNVIDIVLKELDQREKNCSLYCCSVQRLSLLLKSINCSSDSWSHCIEQYPLIGNVLLNNNQLSGAASVPVVGSAELSCSSSQSSDPMTGLIPILLSSDLNQANDQMKSLFQQSQESAHITMATSLKGNGKEYVTLEQIKNPIAAAHYNMLVQKAECSLNDENYLAAHEFYSAAAQFLSSSKSIPNPVRHSLIPVLMEHSLRMRILDTGRSLRNLSNKQACDRYSALIDEAKSHYGNNKNPNRDPSVITLSGVFLLNLQQYNFIAHCDFLGLHERICPKLAMAALCIKESQDLRRCTRELFETVSAVFTSPPVAAARGAGGASMDEKMQLQRKYLEIISNNLQDLVSLSYLMAALARLWNLVKKPEYDISIEYTGHWPTAVGHVTSIDSDHVLRALQVLVTHSLQLLPSYSLWLIIQGDIFLTTGDYSSALRCYLEAGAQESDFFEVEVPESVWNKQVYHRIIVCCLKLNYHSHALVICQMFDPPNYSFTFSLLKEHIQHLLENMFEYLWDMSVIEVLIYSLGKQGDTVKQKAAIQVASRPELNVHNHGDILSQAKNVRKRTFLRMLYKTIIIPTRPLH